MTDTHTKHPRALEEDARAIFMLGGRIWVRNPCRPLSAAGKGNVKPAVREPGFDQKSEIGTIFGVVQTPPPC